MKGNEIVLPKLRDQISVNKQPKHSRNYWVETNCPFTIYDLDFLEKSERLEEFEPIIVDNLPSFPNLKSAAFHYLYSKKYDPNREIGNNLTIQIDQKECWIDKVLLESSSISIKAKGFSVKDKRLEVKVGNQHYETVLKDKKTQKILLNSGLKNDIWILVSKDNCWLDYRKIDLNYLNYSSKDEDLVVKHLDKQVEIKGIISRGEGESTEFKIQVPEANKSHRLTRTVAAFANANGGVIVIGIQDNTGKIIGVKDDLDNEQVRLAQMIKNNLTHLPIYSIYTQKLEGKDLLIVEVKAGNKPPYGINHSNPSYYVRRGATTFPAGPDEIRNLLQSDKITDIQRFL